MDVVDDLVVATDSHDGRAGGRAGRGRGGAHRRRATSTRHRPGGRGGRRARSSRGFDVVVNIQGDEPFLPREALAGAHRPGRARATTSAPRRRHSSSTLADDPGPGQGGDRRAAGGRSTSRAPSIPHRREPADPSDGLYWQHLGVYAYTRAALARWVALPPTPAELAERLEQLRALQHGMTIGVARLDRAGAARRGYTGRPAPGGGALARTSGGRRHDTRHRARPSTSS